MHENFNNSDERPSYTALSTLNPLTVNDGTRNAIDSTERRSGLMLSAMPAINNAKPPLFRHQMMLRASEPYYLSPQQQNSLSVSNDNASEPRTVNNAIVRVSQEHNQNDNSDRKNPLAYLLASVNASNDTWNNR